MKRFFLVSAALLGLQAAGCDKQQIDNVPYVEFDMAVAGDLASSVTPLPPFIGAQIDRAGRPAVNTALTNPFDRMPQGKTVDAVKNEYNVATPQTWVRYAATPTSAMEMTYIPTNLAIFDALDGTCGNQGLYTAVNGMPGLSSYGRLATVLADDRLHINTARGSCMSFLAVENGNMNDCGGRTPLTDVVDALYTFLSGSATNVPDGVTADPDGTYPMGSLPPSLSVFPFLIGPK